MDNSCFLIMKFPFILSWHDLMHLFNIIIFKVWFQNCCKTIDNTLLTFKIVGTN